MKKSTLSRHKSTSDTNIEQYCQSVEALLKDISDKEGTRHRSNKLDEYEGMDNADEFYLDE